MSNVPFIDLGRTVERVRADVLSAWQTCLEKNWFVGGDVVGQCEAELRQRSGAPHFVACANGTDAILIALQALGVGPGKKVAIPNLTFWATYEAVAQLGATAVLVDIDAADLQMSFDGLAQAHKTHRLDAVVLVHLMGWCSARLGEFRKFCAQNDLPLVEDAAQAWGVKVDGRSVLADAQVATLSFYPAKVLGGCMDGGGITTTLPALEKEMRTLCNHGRATHYSYSHVGWNSRMGGLQAAFLKRVAQEEPFLLDTRLAAFARYEKLLEGGLGGKVKLHRPPRGVTGNGYLLVLTLEDGQEGEAVVAALKERGIGSARTYPETIDAQAPTRGKAIVAGDMSVSRRFCKTVVNLPLFAGIRDDEVDASVAALRSVLG